jgi:DNA polymerase III delta prime subunit
MKKSVSDIAFEYAKSGLSVIPTGKDKRPVLREWRPYQQSQPKDAEIKGWFKGNNQNLAVICGRVSGNLEVLDFDFNAEALQKWTQNVQKKIQSLINKLVIEKSPHGAHVLYRCINTKIPGNTKLARIGIEVFGPGEHRYSGKTLSAQRVDGKYFITPTLIETRGEGGYCIVYPSQGYELKQGEIHNIPTISPEEREILIQAAFACNEWIPPQDVIKGYDSPASNSARLPGQDFHERGDIREVLKKHGWTSREKSNDGRERWTRPGKENGKGHSATLTNGKVFYVFSSNAYPFENDHAYGPFAVYTILEHEGDFSAASRALAAQGYGSRRSKAVEAEGKPKAKLRSLNELSTKFSGKISWLWRQHLPRGMPVIFNGREGVGKTKNCLAIARDILEENPQAVIVWVASEGFVSDTVAKAYEVGLPMDGGFRIAEKPDGSYRFDLRWGEDRELLAGVLEEVRDNLACVFIDSIRGMTGGDDNDPKTGSVMHKVNSIVCDRFGATLLYLDHWKKGRAENLLDKAVGTTAKTAAVRLVLSIVPASAYTRRIKMAKSNISPSIPTLRSLEVDNNIIIEQETEEGEETLFSKCEQFLISVFSEKTEVLAADIYAEGKELGFTDSLLRKVKAKIGVDHKKVEGRYVWLSPYRESAHQAHLNFEDQKNNEKTEAYMVVSGVVQPGVQGSGVPGVRAVPGVQDVHNNRETHTKKNNSEDNKLNDFPPDYIEGTV